MTVSSSQEFLLPAGVRVYATVSQSFINPDAPSGLPDVSLGSVVVEGEYEKLAGVYVVREVAPLVGGSEFVTAEKVGEPGVIINFYQDGDQAVTLDVSPTLA